MKSYSLDRRLFNSRYIKHLKNDRRLQIFYGGASSGKSYFLAQRCVIDVANGGRNYLCVRKTANTIKRSIFNEIVKAIQRFKLSDCFSINKTDFVITCKNGYQILFAGLDDSEKIKSITPSKGALTDIWIEEATEVEENDVLQLSKRMRGQSDYKKRMVLSFNPILRSHWICSKYFTNWADNDTFYQDENMTILKTTYKDNEFLTLDDIKGLEEETDNYYKEVYTLGNWGVLGALIFKNWSIADCSQIRKIADNYKNGCDFGFAEDPAAIVITYYDKVRRRIYILNEVYSGGLTNDLLADKIINLIGNDTIVCDSAEPKSIAELKRYGIKALPARKGRDSVLHGIQWLQQQEIIIDISCRNMINEIQQYKWREDKYGNALPVPVDKNNHLIDALRYAYEVEMADRKIRTLPKRALGL